jgi:hypothetical protein
MKRTRLFPQDTARVRKLSTAAEKFRICPDLVYSRRHYQCPQKRAQRGRYLRLWQLLTPAERLGRETAAFGEDSGASFGLKLLSSGSIISSKQQNCTQTHLRNVPAFADAVKVRDVAIKPLSKSRSRAVGGPFVGSVIKCGRRPNESNGDRKWPRKQKRRFSAVNTPKLT